MERREFIKVATTSTVAAVGAPVCVPDLMRQAPGSVPAPQLAAAPDMRAYTARYDAGMKRIGQWSLSSQHPQFTGDRAAVDSLARSSLQALFVTGMLGDLPLEAQIDPLFQERMHAALPIVDDAAERMTEFLTSRTESDFAQLHAVMRQSDAATRIANVLDAEAALCGVSASRRTHMRTMLTQIQWRLTYQAPALFVNEYLEKADRLAASDVDTEARKQWVAARIGPRLLDPQQTPPPSLQKSLAARGAKVMGIGVLVFAGGALIVALGALPGVFVMTVGAVMVLVGLIMLIVGAATPASK